MSVLCLSDVSKRYGDRAALRAVSFEVGRGEIFGLLGPNGAGKTTSIRIVMDIVRADSGTVTLFGEPLARSHLERLAYLPEERGLYSKQSVIDVMVYFGKLKGLDARTARSRALSWLERMGLGHVARHNVERLSKGMSQKVQLAATLLSEPELCVLDEPFSGLDPVNTALVCRLIEEVRASGRTVILSTHQMSMVETLCDRVALLSAGKLVIYGDVEDVRRRHTLPELAVRIEGALPELAGVERVTGAGDGSHRLMLRPDADDQAILRALLDSGVKVHAFERVLAPMEDIFIAVVRESGGGEA